MSKKRNILLVVLSVAACFIGVWHVSKIPYYKPATEQKGLTVENHADDTIRIAYIGDSWAARHSRMPKVLDSLLSSVTGKDVIVRDAGISGLNSKDIYYSIFYDDDVRSAIEWGPDFCFVSAGINDTDHKVGSTCYKENMRLIIKTLLQHRITPVILEIPHYDISYVFWHRSWIVQFRAVRSMLWTLSSLNCIDAYTRSYNELLAEQHWQQCVITIRRDDWNPEGYKDARNLYVEDRMHLNEKGYYTLDSCIAVKIGSSLSSTRSIWP